jgi:hypothetical protein
MTANGKVFSRKIKFFITISSIDLEICCEIVSTKSCSDKSLFTNAEYFFAVYNGTC